jgi:cytochrome c5
MKRLSICGVIPVAVAVLLMTLPLVGQDAPVPKNPKPYRPAARMGNPSESEQGQEVFNQNCSRCHKAPEAIPPSISGTVALHMRIRAGLSEKDYKRLLAFLNP